MSIHEEPPQNNQSLKEATGFPANQENNDSNAEASDSDQSPLRKRHDSDSEHEGGLTGEQKEEKDQKSMKRTFAAALGVDENDKDSDLSPARLEEADEEADRQRKLLKVAEQFKNAETVFRDEKGIKIDISRKFEDKKAELLRKNQERIMEWGGGLVQKQERQEKKKYLKGVKGKIMKIMRGLMK